MPEEIINKNRKTIRLKNYNYSSNGVYFVTICIKGKEGLFGNIFNQKMKLSELGKTADNIWMEMQNKFLFIKLDEYIVMPDHIHGIIEIINPCAVGTRFIASKYDTNNIKREDAMNRVPTGGMTGKNNPMLNPDSLSNVMRWYKGRCAFEIRRKNNPYTFAWQSRFYDRIIRDEIELNKIREYIRSNPAAWERDRNLPARFDSARRAGETGNLEDMRI